MMGIRIEGQCPRCKGKIVEFDYVKGHRESLVIYCILCGRNKDSYPRNTEEVKTMVKTWGLKRAENNIGTIQGI